MSHKISELISNVLTLNSTLTFDNDQVKAAISGTEGLDNFTQKKRTFLAVVKLTELQEIKALIDLANLCASDQDLAFTPTLSVPEKIGATVVANLVALKKISFC
jgi:4-cresol dehydrogenase (hydroxylating)